jgi:hypothetical protein
MDPDRSDALDNLALKRTKVRAPSNWGTALKTVDLEFPVYECRLLQGHYSNGLEIHVLMYRNAAPWLSAKASAEFSSNK